VTLPVQVNGKRRFTIEVPATAGQAEIAELLAQHPGYPRRDIARVVIVPGKIVNVVLRLAGRRCKGGSLARHPAARGGSGEVPRAHFPVLPGRHSTGGRPSK
jgi:hypothetical protein